MGSAHHLHLDTVPGDRRGVTADSVDAEIHIREEDGQGKAYGVLKIRMGSTGVTFFLDHAQTHAIAAKIASDLLAQLPVIGEVA